MVEFNQDEIYNNINSLFEAKAEIIHEIDRNKLAILKLQLGDRWFDDIVNNLKSRKDK